VVSSSGDKHILLIEDHEDSAEIMTLLLKAEGYLVRWVNTAAAALRELATTTPKPDVILLDLTLPDEDGLELGKKLRAMPDAPPIVVMSAKAASAVENAAKSIGAAGAIRKPFATETLLTTVRQVAGEPDR
jgi:DNA-binding response OmpR family regulator